MCAQRLEIRYMVGHDSATKSKPKQDLLPHETTWAICEDTTRGVGSPRQADTALRSREQPEKPELIPTADRWSAEVGGGQNGRTWPQDTPLQVSRTRSS